MSSKTPPIPRPRPKREEDAPAWSMLDPRPLDQTPVGLSRRGGGGNSMLADWIAQEHKGPYDRTYGQQDLGESYSVDRGQLTFDAEGMEGGRYHSRTPHVPGGASGVTIGRGYDIGQHSGAASIRDLVAAGMSTEQAEAYAAAAGKSGAAATRWLQANRDQLQEISPELQHSLFETTYAEMSGDVQRISNKADTVAAYGDLDLETVDPAIADLLVDLRYRGDYTSRSRRTVQPMATGGDLEGLAGNLNDRSRWSSVPEDRFNRRAAYATEAVEERQAEKDLPWTFAAPLEQLGSPEYDLYGRKKSARED